MASIEEKVTTLLQDRIEEVGYELYDVEYAKEGKNYFLRIFIDSKNGIDLDDCEKVNNAIMDLLDEADYIKEQYFLEVSSPGIERILRKDKHLDMEMGEEIEISLFKQMNGTKLVDGILTGYNSESINVLHQDGEIQILRKDISQIKTKYNWNDN